MAHPVIVIKEAFLKYAYVEAKKIAREDKKTLFKKKLSLMHNES